jgi:hypothetical protein
MVANTVKGSEIISETNVTAGRNISNNYCSFFNPTSPSTPAFTLFNNETSSMVFGTVSNKTTSSAVIEETFIGEPFTVQKIDNKD